MNQYAIIARLISAVMSWIDAGNLRNQMYAQQSRIEVLETALEDIERISASRVAVSEQHRLIVKIIETTLK